VNGILTDQHTLEFPTYSSDVWTGFTLGHDPADPTRHLDGTLDDVEIFPFALSPDEVQHLAANR
jgi:hypothetical protein